MSAHTSTSPTPEEPQADAHMPSSKEPSEPLSATAAAAAGTLDSSAFHKERRSSISMKRHHDDDIDYDKSYEKEDSRGGALNDIDDDDDSNRALRETRTSSTASATASDAGDTIMTGSPATKKKRISVQLPEHIRAQKAAAVAAAVAAGELPPKPERTSSTSSSPPTTPHTPHTPSSLSARRGSMTEDQKRASFALTLAKALRASYPLSPITTSSPTSVSPHILSIATTLEQSLYSRHQALTTDYTAHVRDIAFNLTHSSALARRIVDGRVSIERVSGMNWKEFADGEVQREREERKEEDIVAHLAPVDVTPGILPNAHTVER